MVVEAVIPAMLVDPRKMPISPDAHPNEEAIKMVVLPNVRVEEVSNRVLLVQVEEQVAVSEHERPGHICIVIDSRMALAATLSFC
jgi:hypothetical protein